jgi:ketose-bisphosphate aldolase
MIAVAEIMCTAGAARIVVPALNVPYLPMMAPICEALTQHDTFGLVEVARLEITKFEAHGIADVAAEYRKFADRRTSRLHLDHIPAIDEDGLTVDWEPLIAEGIARGYDSVMIDGSRLPFDDNVRVTARVVEMAHAAGVAAEAELGAVLGHESGPLPPYEELFASKRGFTDPEMAREFVERTRVDWLSVSVGSVHGAIAGAAKDREKIRARLDIDHLKRIKDVTGIPLVLHGGSGIEQRYVDEAIANGVAKINIGTDIRQPYERATAAGAGIEEAQAAVAETMARLICDVYHVQGSASRLYDLMGQSA